MPGERELEADPEAVQRRVADADQAHRRGRAGRRCRSSWSYLRRLERDVVAEPLRLLVGVGVAADVDEQRRVVDDEASLVVEADPLGQAQRDQALTQHVLHRLTEAEIDPQGQRRDQFGQTYLCAAARSPTDHYLMIQAIWPLTRCFWCWLTRLAHA